MSVKVDTNIYQVVIIIKSSTNYINKIPVNVSCSLCYTVVRPVFTYNSDITYFRGNERAKK